MEKSKQGLFYFWKIIVIDGQGYRANVCIVITNGKGQLFWGRRIGQDAWQFPQGGVNSEESTEDAMYRELHEEVGLKAEHVKILASSNGWLRYRLPSRLVRHDSKPVCIGQKQWWFLLELTGSDQDFDLSHSDSPEFDHWAWVNYWYPLNEVVAFKREVYRRALRHFSKYVFAETAEPVSLDSIFEGVDSNPDPE